MRNIGIVFLVCFIVGAVIGAGAVETSNKRGPGHKDCAQCTCCSPTAGDKCCCLHVDKCNCNPTDPCKK